jgi:predicted SprT family Zn-dependent metalloprotease
MKSVLSPSKLSGYTREFRAKLDTLKAEKCFLQSKTVNVEVRDANLSELFIFYDNAFFGGQLEGKVMLEWSIRMTQCAGICYCSQFDTTGKGTFCTVRLSKKLLMYRTHSNLLETLLHELIHAFLFVTKPRYARNDGVDGHGPAFIQKMTEINDITNLHLSVYHSFSDEVKNCQEHVWICDGKCGF